MVREYDQLMERLLADEPLFERDDEHNWDARYRQIAAEQRVRIREAATVIVE